MVLLHEVVEVLHLPHEDWHLSAGIDLIHGRLVGVALVDGYLLGNSAGLHGFVKKTQCCGFALPCLA